MSLVIYGPQGCGKTQHAVALAKHFGLNIIYDGWHFGERIPLMNVMALTNAEPQPEYAGLRVLSFDEAMRQVRAAGAIDATSVGGLK